MSDLLSLNPKPPISDLTNSSLQVCRVCEEEYDLVYSLDDGVEQLQEILTQAGGEFEKEIKLDPTKLRTVSNHTRKKFFSELSVEEMKNLYTKFKQDFILFGYNLDFYKHDNNSIAHTPGVPICRGCDNRSHDHDMHTSAEMQVRRDKLQLLLQSQPQPVRCYHCSD